VRCSENGKPLARCFRMQHAPPLPAFAAIIVAAGKGIRAGQPLPKQFAKWRGKPVLRHSVGCDIDPDAFAEAVSDGLSRPEALAARAFQLRADDLLHGLDPARATGRLSGLLVGAELAHARPYWLGMQTALIGASKLSQTYASALESQGVTPVIERGDACTLAGLRAAFARWKD